jgi:hypothetical protein
MRPVLGKHALDEMPVERELLNVTYLAILDGLTEAREVSSRQILKIQTVKRSCGIHLSARGLPSSADPKTVARSAGD